MNSLIYCLRHLLDDWRFYHMGVRIYDHYTLADIGVEDGDYIDARTHGIIRLLR
jgi:hypothetical protein